MKTRSQGTTLMELMMALTVLGIVMAIAVPSFREITANSRVSAATNDFVTALTIARSEALKRGSITRICSSTDQANCSGSNNWETGWVVFSDLNNNAAVDADELVQVWLPLTAGTTALGTASDLAYSPNGMGLLPGGAFQVDITPPFCSGDKVGRIVVSVVGSPTSSRLACP
jgi:type IV fimbrial biogenesis protein FimT